MYIKNIFRWGRSIGGSAAVYLAQRLSKEKNPPFGLILQCSFLSICRLHWNYRFKIFFDMFDNLSRIGDVRCPVFILHGEKDPLVPVWGARVLYKYF